jgi:hypothetical protein
MINPSEPSSGIYMHASSKSKTCQVDDTKYIVMDNFGMVLQKLYVGYYNPITTSIPFYLLRVSSFFELVGDK